jgi:hypothetical protein
MPIDYPWYGLVSGEQLEQGDFLIDCPLFRSNPDGSIRRDRANVVVMSQSCDLVQGKLEVIQVCPHWPLETLSARDDYFRSKRGREDLRRGHLPGYHLLNSCQLPGHETQLLVVDFRSLFGLQFGAASEVIRHQPTRFRLLPPYREHLAQAFARFFMRVGLPVDIPPF